MIHEKSSIDWISLENSLKSDGLFHRCRRQTGRTAAMVKAAIEYALANPDSKVCLISANRQQAENVLRSYADEYLSWEESC